MVEAEEHHSPTIGKVPFFVQFEIITVYLCVFFGILVGMYSCILPFIS